MLGGTEGHGAGLASRALAAVIVGLVALAGCSSDDEAAADLDSVSQSEYVESAREFEAEREGYAEEIVACAADRGVEAEATWDHGFALPPGLAEQEAEEYWEVVQGCAEATYPPEREPSTDELEEQYGLLLAAKRCLEDEGYDPGEPSGFDDFLAAYESDGAEVPWSPYAAVGGDLEAFQQAVEVCPQPGRF